MSIHPISRREGMPTTSLVIATYNWPAALDLVLRSVRAQRMLPDEVIVADDGSGDTTRYVILAHQGDFPVPLRHVWQEDRGFRVAAIRNEAIRQRGATTSCRLAVTWPSGATTCSRSTATTSASPAGGARTAN
jgi:glycosyltransferase involved in cell wall biosynthesis